MTKVFIDGSAGTTGLRIKERLSERKDIELIILSDAVRKNETARRDAIINADIAFLCLPDDASRDTVKLVGNSDTVIIDTSTAHRTADGWTYGFPELLGYREKIAASKRISNPGCHASGFISLVKPLVQKGIIDSGTQLSVFSLTGYSGGGKKMILQYESVEKDTLFNAPRMYGLSQNHKHLSEMMNVCGLENSPVFCPVVAPYYSGMEVTVPLFNTDIEKVKQAYKDYYKTGMVKFVDNFDEDGFASASILSGRDDMLISVFGNNDRLILMSRFDNLGKGASGAAIQNMNIVLGLPEDTGLNISTN